MGPSGTIFGRQPVLIMTAIQLAIIAACSFGLNLTGQQVGLLILFSAALLGILANTLVTPVAMPSLPQGTVVEVVTPKGQPNQSVTL